MGGRTRGRPGPLDSGDIVRRLLDRNADAECGAEGAIFQRQHTFGDGTLGKGATPFMRAAKSGDVEMMKLLLAGGSRREGHAAEFHRADARRRLRLARRQPCRAVLRSRLAGRGTRAIALLLDLGFDINAVTTTATTALHLAVTGRGSRRSCAS